MRATAANSYIDPMTGFSELSRFVTRLGVCIGKYGLCPQFAMVCKLLEHSL